jgi:hypothetical protein
MHNVQRTTQESNTNNNKGDKTYRKKKERGRKNTKGKFQILANQNFIRVQIDFSEKW